jgi:hypothetical protein
VTPPVLEEFFVEVDGQHFRVWTDDLARHGYNHDWLDGPSTGYGFSSSSRHRLPTPDDHRQRIRGFLEQIDPETGYLPG